MLRAIVADAAMYARVPETPALCAWATGLLRSGDIVEYVPATAADVAAMRRRCGPSVEQQLDAVMAEYAPGYTLDDLIAATDGRTI
ncbi:MAG TPA: hypothetical protein VGS10_11375 [Terracidiphilus sp.]|nr:hypothetical protein [Terracidiphilus sp.]